MTGQCSSATNDLEASHAIFDLRSGEQLLPKPSAMYSWLADGSRRVAEIVLAIAPHLPRFGHQYEMILRPNAARDQVVSLVQVRPSPFCVRASESFELPQASPVSYLSPAAWTGQRSGSVTRINGSEMDTYGLMAPTEIAAHCAEIYQRAINKGADSVEKTFSGKIIVWNDLAYRVSERLHVLCGAAYMGAEGQITVGACFKNSSHDGFRPYTDYTRDEYDKLIQQCLFVGVSKGEYQDLENNISDGENITLSCDGFVTAVIRS